MEIKLSFWVVYFSCHISMTSSLIVNGNHILNAIGQLREQINDVVVKIDNMEAKIGSLEFKVAEKNAHIDTEEKLVNIEKMLMSWEEKMGSVTDNFKTFISSIIDDKIGKVETTMVNMEEKVEKMDEKIDKNVGIMKTMESNFVDMKATMGVIETKVGRIELKTANLDTNRSNVEEGIGKINSNIGNLTKKIESMEIQIVSVETNVNYIIEKVDSIDSGVENATANIESIESTKTTLNKKINDVVEKMIEIGSKVNSTDAKIGSLDSKIAKIDTKTSSIDDNLIKMVMMEIKIDNTAATIKSIDANIVEMKNKVGIMETKLDELMLIPNLLEKYLQKYNMSGKQLTHSPNLTTYPLLQRLLKNIHFTAVPSFMTFVSCYQISRVLEISQNGVFDLYPYQDKEKFARKSINAYCDMESDGGGWTVFQRRGIPGNLTDTDRTDLFIKNWNEYKVGFGDPNCDYWLGLETIHQLTKDCNHELLITATEVDGSFHQVHYSTFGVSSEENKFKLSVGGYIKENSTLEDWLKNNNEQNFSTIDRDNDYDPRHCSALLKANGFWFHQCGQVVLNGMYPSSINPDITSINSYGMIWYSVSGKWFRLKRTEMKIRPKC